MPKRLLSRRTDPHLSCSAACVASFFTYPIKIRFVIFVQSSRFMRLASQFPKEGLQFSTGLWAIIPFPNESPRNTHTSHALTVDCISSSHENNPHTIWYVTDFLTRTWKRDFSRKWHARGLPASCRSARRYPLWPARIMPAGRCGTRPGATDQWN